MKNLMSMSVAFALFTPFALTASASGQNSGVSAAQAASAVQTAAHRFIAKIAPDFGGFVKSPCAVNLIADQYTVTCKGSANETIGGDGSVRIGFQCVGDFQQGQNGLFFKASPIRCKSI